MLKVTGKTVYQDGVLFRTVDEATKEMRLLSEPTLMSYISAKRVRNASVVNRNGKEFVRLASGIPTVEDKSRKVKDAHPVSAKETTLARQRFALLGKVAASGRAVKNPVLRGLCRNTTVGEMKKLKDGDTFVVNGVAHVASGDSHLSGDATCDEYIVYDTNGDSWFESDFCRR